MISIEDAFLVINGLEPLDLGQCHLAVVTAGARERFSVPLQRFMEVDEPSFWPFERGEILLLDASGREPVGEGRKPSKWSVHVEHFDNLTDAQACREQVLATEPMFVNYGTGA